jgi:hypothetical protein
MYGRKCHIPTALSKVLQHADAIICEYWSITTPQLVLILSISKGSVSHIIWDLGYSKLRVWDGLVVATKSNTKLAEKPFLPSCWHIITLNDRPSYPRLLQQMKPGSIILNCRQEGNPCNSTNPQYSQKKKIQKVSINELGHDYCIQGLESSYSCGCAANREEN